MDAAQGFRFLEGKALAIPFLLPFVEGRDEEEFFLLAFAIDEEEDAVGLVDSRQVIEVPGHFEGVVLVGAFAFADAREDDHRRRGLHHVEEAEPPLGIFAGFDHCFFSR